MAFSSRMGTAYVNKFGLILSITGFFFFIELMIAFSLKIAGFNGPIQPSFEYYNFINRILFQIEQWNVAIPSIPLIPKGTSYGGLWVIIDWLIDFGNFFIGMINGVIALLNFIINIFVFFVAMFKVIFSLNEMDLSASGPLSYWVDLTQI